MLTSSTHLAITYHKVRTRSIAQAATALHTTSEHDICSITGTWNTVYGWCAKSEKLVHLLAETDNGKYGGQISLLFAWIIYELRLMSEKIF